MLIYWLLFLLFAAGSLLNQGPEPNRTRLAFVLLASVPTALMIGLRWKIGPDWEPYLEIFQWSRLVSFDQAATHQDPGYYVLNWLVQQLNAPFWVLNLVCGIVFASGLTAFCKRQPNPWLAFLVAFPYLVIVIGMSGNRQSLALGFLFFALNAFERGKLVRFLAFIVAGALFHGSVLLLVPLCLLSYSRNGLQRAALLLLAALLGFYFFRDIFHTYAERYSSEQIQSSGVAYRFAMNAAAALLFLIFERRFAFDEHQTKLWRNVSIATVVMGLLLLVIPSSTAVDRFLLYLFPLQFVVFSRLPYVLTEDRKGAGQLTMVVIGYAALVQVTFLVFGTFARFYVPYRSIL